MSYTNIEILEQTFSNVEGKLLRDHPTWLEIKNQLAAVQQGLGQFIEQAGDVHFQRYCPGPKEGEIRWDIEFGPYYGAVVSGKTLREAITKAIAAQAKHGGV